MMMLKILLIFLLFDGVLAFFLWLLLHGDRKAADLEIDRAYKKRDRAIDEWFRAQEET